MVISKKWNYDVLFLIAKVFDFFWGGMVFITFKVKTTDDRGKSGHGARVCVVLLGWIMIERGERRIMITIICSILLQ